MTTTVDATTPRTRPAANAWTRIAGQVALGARMLSIDGHDDFNQGQISGRLPGHDTFVIKDGRSGFDEATPQGTVSAGVEREHVPDPSAPPELPLHQAIYRARPDVNGIVHSHAPHTLVFGATDLELRPVSHGGAYFTGRLAMFTATSNTVLDQETGDAIAAALAGHDAVLLRNHGSVVVGKSVRHAAVLAQVLEHACRLQLLAQQTGVPYTWADATDVEAKRDYIYADLSIRSYWDWAARRVVRTWPEAAAW